MGHRHFPTGDEASKGGLDNKTCCFVPLNPDKSNEQVRLASLATKTTINRRSALIMGGNGMEYQSFSTTGVEGSAVRKVPSDKPVRIKSSLKDVTVLQNEVKLCTIVARVWSDALGKRHSDAAGSKHPKRQGRGQLGKDDDRQELGSKMRDPLTQL
jgi:hypothetical protein